MNSYHSVINNHYFKYENSKEITLKTCTDENHVLKDNENLIWIEGDLDIYQGLLAWRNGAFGNFCECGEEIVFPPEKKN